MDNILNIIESYYTNNLVGFIVDLVLLLAGLITMGIVLNKKVRKSLAILCPIICLLVIAASYLLSLEIIKYTLLCIITFVVITTLVASRGVKPVVKQNVSSTKPVKATDDEEIKRCVKEITEAVDFFASRHIGALITFEANESLHAYTEKATKIDSVISEELLKTIFFPNTALHDGGVIICGTRIVSAGTYYPITERSDLPSHYGTRHRAAIGISEKSDAFTIVVSEETGTISTTYGGTITSNQHTIDLTNTIEKYLKGSEY